jgi:hypothetical protein
MAASSSRKASFRPIRPEQLTLDACGDGGMWMGHGRRNRDGPIQVGDRPVDHAGSAELHFRLGRGCDTSATGGGRPDDIPNGDCGQSS